MFQSRHIFLDDSIAQQSGWDEELLAEELSGLLEMDLDFDIGVTGFSIPEIDSLLETVEPEEPGNPEDDIVVTNAPMRVQAGDIWQFGPHRLVCGDALDPTTIDHLYNLNG